MQVLDSPSPPKEETVLTETGFVVLRNGRENLRITWSQVTEVYAHKDDLWSYDEICVGFVSTDPRRFWAIGESDPVYQQILGLLPAKFPGIRMDWFSDVAFPAFVTNRTLLWPKPPAT
jgi:hypothetical protein